ncbi:hypothetical protein GF327_00675 [Candidatus Woesearchaeota archaeon]|nr:hypothetical protein [Candidatus Woesearchaeota archaeon]
MQPNQYEIQKSGIGIKKGGVLYNRHYHEQVQAMLKRIPGLEEKLEQVSQYLSDAQQSLNQRERDLDEIVDLLQEAGYQIPVSDEDYAHLLSYVKRVLNSLDVLSRDLEAHVPSRVFHNNTVPSFAIDLLVKKAEGGDEHISGFETPEQFENFVLSYIQISDLNQTSDFLDMLKNREKSWEPIYNDSTQISFEDTFTRAVGSFWNSLFGSVNAQQDLVKKTLEKYWNYLPETGNNNKTTEADKVLTWLLDKNIYEAFNFAHRIGQIDEFNIKLNYGLVHAILRGNHDLYFNIRKDFEQGRRDVKEDIRLAYKEYEKQISPENNDFYSRTPFESISNILDFVYAAQKAQKRVDIEPSLGSTIEKSYVLEATKSGKIQQIRDEERLSLKDTEVAKAVSEGIVQINESERLSAMVEAWDIISEKIKPIEIKKAVESAPYETLDDVMFRYKQGEEELRQIADIVDDSILSSRFRGMIRSAVSSDSSAIAQYVQKLAISVSRHPEFVDEPLADSLATYVLSSCPEEGYDILEPIVLRGTEQAIKKVYNNLFSNSSNQDHNNLLFALLRKAYQVDKDTTEKYIKKMYKEKSFDLPTLIDLAKDSVLSPGRQTAAAVEKALQQGKQNYPLFIDALEEKVFDEHTQDLFSVGQQVVSSQVDNLYKRFEESKPWNQSRQNANCEFIDALSDVVNRAGKYLTVNDIDRIVGSAVDLEASSLLEEMYELDKNQFYNCVNADFEKYNGPAKIRMIEFYLAREIDQEEHNLVLQMLGGIDNNQRAQKIVKQHIIDRIYADTSALILKINPGFENPGDVHNLLYSFRDVINRADRAEIFRTYIEKSGQNRESISEKLLLTYYPDQ